MKTGQKKILHVKVNGEDHSSSSEDDEEAKFLTDDIEQRFFHVINRLKRKDPKLYDENEKFFTLEGSPAQDSGSQQNQLKSAGEKLRKSLKSGRRNSSTADDFWASSNLNSDEQFLRDYILKKKFLDRDETVNLATELERLSDEEKELEEQTKFEEKYNCRFEQFDEDFLKKYPNAFKRAQGERRKHNSETEFEEKTEVESKSKINNTKNVSPLDKSIEWPNCTKSSFSKNKNHKTIKNIEKKKVQKHIDDVAFKINTKRPKLMKTIGDFPKTKKVNHKAITDIKENPQKELSRRTKKRKRSFSKHSEDGGKKKASLLEIKKQRSKNFEKSNNVKQKMLKSTEKTDRKEFHKKTNKNRKLRHRALFRNSSVNSSLNSKEAK